MSTELLQEIEEQIATHRRLEEIKKQLLDGPSQGGLSLNLIRHQAPGDDIIDYDYPNVDSHDDWLRQQTDIMDELRAAAIDAIESRVDAAANQLKKLMTRASE